MFPWRSAALLVLWLPIAAAGQTFNLSESAKVGECCRISIETGLTGSINFAQDGKVASIDLSAKNQHLLVERALAVDKGVIRKSARYYETAASRADIGMEKAERSLRDTRRLVVAQRIDDRLLCYSPTGPLTRPELEVISEHFDTLQLIRLLPGKEVMIGDQWTIDNAAVQALCLFDGLIAHDLSGKLTEVKDGQAVITVAGKAEGIELGASVKLEIAATARFDLLAHRLTAVEWKQKDVRELGPASPASQMESVTMIKRTVLDEEPKELSKAALASVPQEDEPQELLKLLQHTDMKNRFSFLYARDWHIVGQTENHLVLRLLDRGDFIAQVTVAAWKKEAPGKHLSAEEFKKQVVQAPNWAMEEVADAGEVPADDGHWIYRVTARGDLEGTKVVQIFFLVAGPDGDQVAVTFTMKPANAAKIGTRDLAIVSAIQFADKKK